MATEHAKHVADGVSVITVIGTLAEILPAIASGGGKPLKIESRPKDTRKGVKQT